MRAIAHMLQDVAEVLGLTLAGVVVWFLFLRRWKNISVRKPAV